MFQSHVIEADGVFLGAAVHAPAGFRLRAVHPQVEELDGFAWPSLEALRRATTHLYRTGRLGVTAPADHAVPAQFAAIAGSRPA